MFRPMSLSLSTSYYFLVNDHRSIHHVSSSPSKIPYGGFSPVRLQTGIQRRPSLLWAYTPLKLMFRRRGLNSVEERIHAQSAHSSVNSSDPVQRPLAPQAGYVVPLDHRLLWPHPRLLISPSSLSSSSEGSVSRYPGSQEGPQFTLRICSFVPPSVPRRTQRLHVIVPSSLTLAFATFAQARHSYPTHAGSHVGRVTRLQSSLYATARRIARPSPARAFTFELSPPESPQGDVEYNYTGTQSIPATGLSPARYAALWAAHEKHEDKKIRRV